jgi:signal transduction histidine kinase/DNA-binding response OmpR family regulator
MAKSFASEINQRVEKLLNYPGCDKKTLIIKKTIWTHAMGSLIAIMGLTLGFVFFVPQLTILIYYGSILLFILIPVLIISPFIHRNYIYLVITNLTLMILVSFIFILKLGGITNSAGLIFVGLSSVLSSVPLQNAKITLTLFSVYILTILISGLVDPWLTVPEQMTPKINSVIFLINTLWMSAYLLSIILNFIEQQRLNEQLESKKLKEINEAKTKLFTNITHEFRTPLTIIGGMANLMVKEPEKYLADGVRKINNNTNILLRLVNQMLDISKIEAGAMPVQIIQSDIIKSIGYVTGLFHSMAQRKKISLQLIHDVQSFIMDYDPDKLVQIVSNLLSNAIKFTPEGGNVVIKAEHTGNGQFFELKVADNGVGISANHLLHIFDRFYQVENHASNGGGTGLGLALAKELTEMLNGTISVESSVGTGTTFTVKLPVTQNARIEIQEIQESDKTLFTACTAAPNHFKSEIEPITTNGNLPILLIVEDSDDVSHYLAAILQNEYQVTMAENGKAGLEKALKLIPDIILSDVMMPEMDGISMLEKLKTDFRTSHIPVVMLTAKADIDSRLVGLERGADAYISKPFNENELHIQLRNLIEQRRKLHERYASLSHLPETHDLAIKTEDAFMIKVRQILENNLANEDFSIDHLCKELAVSHAQLYRKFKSISNHTIADYFKLIRLHEAKKLLSNSDLNITQIAFAVGFKNLSHFSREFTQQFGKSPKELRKQEE